MTTQISVGLCHLVQDFFLMKRKYW